MPWCPKCKTEYREGFETCSDCNVSLVGDLEEENRETVFDHEVYLTTANDKIEADILKAKLNSNSIPVLMKHREAGGYLTIYMGNSFTGIDLYVPSKLYQAAKELISVNEESEYNMDDVLINKNKEVQKEEDKIKRKRVFRAWIILLLFAPGLLFTAINMIIIVCKIYFREK